jgi:hypothetical protein
MRWRPRRSSRGEEVWRTQARAGYHTGDRRDYHVGIVKLPAAVLMLTMIELPTAIFMLHHLLPGGLSPAFLHGAILRLALPSRFCCVSAVILSVNMEGSKRAAHGKQ